MVSSCAGKVLFVGVIAGDSDIQDVRARYVHPDRRGVPLPDFQRGILPSYASPAPRRSSRRSICEYEDIFSEALPAVGGILAELFVQKTVRFVFSFLRPGPSKSSRGCGIASRRPQNAG